MLWGKIKYKCRHSSVYKLQASECLDVAEQRQFLGGSKVGMQNLDLNTWQTWV